MRTELWVEAKICSMLSNSVAYISKTISSQTEGNRRSIGLFDTIVCLPWEIIAHSSKVQFSSVTQLCPTLCDPMNHSTPGLPVQHKLPEFTQTHDHWVGGAMQPSHPLSSPSPPAPNSSQHQGLFQWVNSSLCRVHHAKCQDRWSTNWNQDCRQKYQ